MAASAVALLLGTHGAAASAAASGLSLVQFRFQKASFGSSIAVQTASGEAPEHQCAAFGEWPLVDNGVTCGRSQCTALVKVHQSNRGRCDRYCESFGHVCVDANEEVAENCEVKYKAPCHESILHTSDMLCTCHLQRKAGASAALVQGAPSKRGLFGWHASGKKVGHGWCQGEVPAKDWGLPHTCSGKSGQKVKVLTYNLFWWNLFNERGGGEAGRTIAHGGQHWAYDIMAFQECDDMWRVLHNAGLNSSSYSAVNGGHATAIAYKKSKWELLAKGNHDVAEDQPGLYGRRGAAWLRLRRKKTGGKVVFLVNHHGPLMVDTGGNCGGEATAYNILRIVGENAHRGDFVIVTGDFNAAGHSSTARTLERHLKRTFTGTSFGGVDHFFAGCAAWRRRNLGSGGSDHDALEAVFSL